MKNWYDIFPKGTKEGEIEEKIFKSLTRDKKWTFRSVTGMSKELKIKEIIVEKIILGVCVNFVYRVPSLYVKFHFD